MTMNPADTEQKIIIGRFGSPFGVKGWIKVQSFSEPEENLLAYVNWYSLEHNNWSLIKHDDHAKHGKGWIVHLVGYDSPEAVRFLAGTDIAIARSDFPPLAKDEFYINDIVGFSAINVQGVGLGKVMGFVDSGAHELLVIEGEKEYLIPLIKDRFLKAIDKTKQQITVDWDADF
ncbi:MAG: rimM [Gammaproteobacteria bacterium]|jgi:16S rRNA processing protein RimM|nr:rimM [Gammaproteobacteria bacterium]